MLLFLEMETAVVAGLSPATIQGVAAGTAACTENGLIADGAVNGQLVQKRRQVAALRSAAREIIRGIRVIRGVSPIRFNYSTI